MGRRAARFRWFVEPAALVRGNVPNNTYVPKSVTLTAIAMALLSASCNPPGPTPQMSALRQQDGGAPSAEAVAFRISADGTVPIRIYKLPDLVEIPWQIPMSNIGVDRIVGYTGERELIYVTTAAGGLFAIDLQAGLSRMIDSSVRRVTMGANGIPYLVLASGAVGSVERRRLTVWVDSGSANPQSIWGGAGSRALVEIRDGEDRTLEFISRTRDPRRWTIPDGDLIVSRWADAAAVLTESGIRLIETRSSDRVRDIELQSRPVAAAFSPAGHRVYVTTAGNELVQIDRYSGNLLETMGLPFAPESVRIDPHGRIIFLKQPGSDTVIAVDAPRMRRIGLLKTRWTPDLPTVGPGGTILAEQGGDLYSFDPESLIELGRVEGIGEDRWVVARWTPERPVLEAEERVAEAIVGEIGEILYVQVSSTRNRDWAEEFSSRLRAAGLDASIMLPDNPDDPFRVVLGPFPTRASAEIVARTLDRPYWIFARQLGPER